MTGTTNEPEACGLNPIRDAIVASVHKALAAQSRTPMRYDDARGAWIARCTAGTHVPPVPLQAGHLAADVTEHGALILPVGARGRHAVDVRFATDSGPLEPVEVAVLPGAVEISLAGGGIDLIVDVPVGQEGVTWQPRVLTGGPAWLMPYLVWTPASDEAAADLPLLRPRELPVIAETATSSNSRLPDPFPPEDLPTVSMRLDTHGADRPPMGSPWVPGSLLAERETPAGTVVTALPGWNAAAIPGARVTLGVAPMAPDVGLAQPLVVRVPDERITRQLRYGAPTSMMSVARGAGGHPISTHGCRDQGFGDVAHLHQSHQMHYVALVRGATDRVRDELLAFASLQDGDGAIRRAPGVATASYPYVPGFTEAHLLLGVHRYVSWTGDLDVLDQPVTGADGTVKLQDRLLAAAGSLLSRGSTGLLAPCGRLDAWPPTVLAQAQVSMTGAEAFEALAAILEARGEDATGISRSAVGLRTRIDDVFLDHRTGLYAEHLFDDGVTGGTPDDFWSHTQISAVLSGQTRDPRGLDLVRERCFRRRITGTTSRTLDAPYVAQSTDPDTELELDSTATWMLATWPELTHRCALAEVALGRPDRALAAVTAQRRPCTRPAPSSPPGTTPRSTSTPATSHGYSPGEATPPSSRSSSVASSGSRRPSTESVCSQRHPRRGADSGSRRRSTGEGACTRSSSTPEHPNQFN